MAAWRLATTVWRVLLSRPWASRRRVATEAPSAEGALAGRVVRGLVYRMIFLPFFIAGVAGLLVYAGTHPPAVAIMRDPISVGIYYDAVTFITRDECRLDGWLVPVLDAKKVLQQQHRVFGAKYPAVVLVHDHANSREQMLPLVRPLHEAGYVVLVTALRGDGAAANRGRTFGLNESLDVAAAVEMLGRRPFVDPTRIGVIGVGTGATAARLAADGDPNVRSLIALRPPGGVDELLVRHIVPERLPWLAPLCRWTFEIAYGVNTSAAQAGRSTEGNPSRLVLHQVGTMDDSSLTEKILDHQFKHLMTKQAGVATVN
jgi:hypothetical protein